MTNVLYVRNICLCEWSGTSWQENYIEEVILIDHLILLVQEFNLE